ncbi:5071_t:CDS:2, partial [Gigaspora rosea]
SQRMWRTMERIERRDKKFTFTPSGLQVLSKLLTKIAWFFVIKELDKRIILLANLIDKKTKRKSPSSKALNKSSAKKPPFVAGLIIDLSS